MVDVSRLYFCYMAHAIYQTQAIILRVKNMRESNKLVTLYTERFGLIYASLQSVRSLSSKMRFHTNIHSLVTVDLVEGRDVWRITGVHEQISTFSFIESSWYPLIVRLSSIILRLCRGQEAEQALWQDIQDLYSLFTQQPKRVSETEVAFILRMLNVLGYWDDSTQVLLTGDLYSAILHPDLANNKSILIKSINTRLQETDL